MSYYDDDLVEIEQAAAAHERQERRNENMDQAYLDLDDRGDRGFDGLPDGIDQ